MPPWFDAEIRSLLDRTAPFDAGHRPVLFIGSSTFTLWHEIERDFPAYAVVNHGFGGSTLADCLEYFDRLVTPVHPGAIILYAGDNDLDQGVSPQRLVDLLGTFIRMKRATVGLVPLTYVSIKISPARLHFMHHIAYTNRLIEGALAGEPDVCYLDITRRMVGRGMLSWRGYYGDDPLHMNREGYRVWGKALSEHLARLCAEGAEVTRRENPPPPAWQTLSG
jgi:lysophospholipase L1-like esterase